MDLGVLFDEVNREWFDGFLDRPELVWNSRLRSSAGRFVPGTRSLPSHSLLNWMPRKVVSPKIEVASYLLEETESSRHVRDTLAHEMIHYWLWVRRRPYGHTGEFLAKMRSMGVSRYNPVPRVRPPKYLYACPVCSKEYPARRRLGQLACGTCCQKHNRGKYDPKFRLQEIQR